MIHVLCVSMPRSGHHFFEVILKNTLQDKYFYCEFYDEGCCKSIPCTVKTKLATQESDLFLQKSHDFEFTDPLLVPGTYRVVQYRSPVPRVLSNYEVHLKNGHKDTVSNFRSYLVSEALYFEYFYKKWLVDRCAGNFVVSYEELTGDPVKVLLDFFKYVEVAVDTTRVVEGVAQSVEFRGRSRSPFLQTDVYSHRYATHPILANFEDLVIRNCPGYYPLRYFTATNSAKSLFGLFFGAFKAVRAGNRDMAMALLEAAAKKDSVSPTYRHILRLAMTMDEGTDDVGLSDGASTHSREQP